MKGSQNKSITIPVTSFLVIGVAINYFDPQMPLLGNMLISFIPTVIIWSVMEKFANGKSSNNLPASAPSEKELKTHEISKLILSNEPFDKVRDIVGGNEIDLPVIQKSFDIAISQALKDNLLTYEEEQRIDRFIEYFKLTQDDLNVHGGYEKFIKSRVIRTLTEGVIPENTISISYGQLPFVFAKNEKLIWLFQNVKIYEDHFERSYTGGSRGVSVRVAKGLYLRAGSFKGKPIVTKSLKNFGSGIFAITNKYIYFNSGEKNFKIPFNKILSINPFEDGLGLHREGNRDKKIVLQNFDGIYAYNLIINLSQI